MKNRNIYSLILLVLVAAYSQSAVQAQSGGTYDLSHSVIASGGGSSTGGAGGAFKVEGTVGQTTAGTNSNGTSITNQYAVRGGFWAFQQALVPTAAQVEVGGRVMAADGNGIRNVMITMTNAQGNTRTDLSSSFGYYRFSDVSVGETYIFTITAKRYSFSQPTQVRNITEATEDINFVADN